MSRRRDQSVQTWCKVWAYWRWLTVKQCISPWKHRRPSELVRFSLFGAYLLVTHLCGTKNGKTAAFRSDEWEQRFKLHSCRNWQHVHTKGNKRSEIQVDSCDTCLQLRHNPRPLSINLQAPREQHLKSFSSVLTFFLWVTGGGDCTHIPITSAGGQLSFEQKIFPHLWRHRTASKVWHQ